MRVSYEWLKSMVDVPDDVHELVEEYTRTGTEVEAVEKVGEGLDHVVTGVVLEKKPHPDSDHMWVTKVSVGMANVDATPSRCRSCAAPRTSTRATTSSSP